MSYVWGLDLSLSSTGVAIFSDDGGFVTSLTIDTKAEKETKLKLKAIGNKYIELIKLYPPSVIVIEQGFSLHNISTEQIFRVHGITNYLLCEYEQIYYPPATVKKTITGKGNATKEEVQLYIHMEYPNIVFGTLDESDAFGVGKTYFIKEGIN
jgi:Holliday junction resolvasome RuvABC endonuclease subunit